MVWLLIIPLAYVKKRLINLNDVARSAKLNVLGHQFCGAHLPEPLVDIHSNVFGGVCPLHTVLSDSPVYQNEAFLQ